MSRFRLILCVVLSMALAGCYTSKLRINLNADGSGTLVVTSTASSGLLGYVQERFGMSLEDRFFGEEQLRQAAKTFGTGVEFRRRNVFDQEDGKVFIATYVFPDINQVRIGAASSMPGMASAPTAAELADAFTFTYSNRLLGIQAPALPAVQPVSPHVKVESQGVEAQRLARFEANRKALMDKGNPFGLQGDETPGDMSRKLMRGLHFRVDLTLPSPVLASTATHVETDANAQSVLVLMDIGAEDLLQSEDFMRRMERGQAQDLDWQEVARLPGIRVETNDIVRVRF